MQQLDCLNDEEGKDKLKSENVMINDQMKNVEDEEQRLQQDLIKQLGSISEKTKNDIKKVEESREQGQRDDTKMIQSFGIAQVQAAYAGQPQLCYDADLGTQDTRDNYINQHCKKIIGSKTSEILQGKTMELLSECMTEEKYCTFCCDYEVGITQVGRKKECMAKCGDALNNIIAPEIQVKLQLVDNKQVEYRPKVLDENKKQTEESNQTKRQTEESNQTKRQTEESNQTKTETRTETR